MRVSPQKAIAVFQRTNGRCGYCGCALDFEGYTTDHMVPRSKGGGNELSNLLACCKTCNRSKAARSVEDFRLVMAARKAGCDIFTASQLGFLNGVGAFPLLNISNDHPFYFESMGVENASL